MKWLKKIVLSILFVLTLLVIVLAIAPSLFKENILKWVKTQVNNELDAKVDFDDASLSFLRSFPNANFRLKGLSIDGVNEFDGTKLVDAPQLDINFNLKSILSKKQKPSVNSILVKDARIELVSDADGNANYNIYSGDTESNTSETEIELDIEKLSMINTNLRYSDLASATYVNLKGINSTSQLQYATGNVIANNNIEIQKVNVRNGKINYLKNAIVGSEFKIDVDTENLIFKIAENKSNVNALDLVLEGLIDINENHQVFDLNFSSPSSDVKQIVSLIPNAYTKGFNTVKASGNLDFSGSIKGINSSNSIPDLKLKSNIQDGFIQYPDLPQNISNIFTNIDVATSNNFQNFQVNLEPFKLNLADDPIQGYLKLNSTASNNSIDTKLKGELDLENLIESFPMDQVSVAQGVLNIDLELKANQADLESKNLENIKSIGSVKSDQLTIKYGEYPQLDLRNNLISLDNDIMTIEVGDLKSKNSSLTAQVKLDNVLSYALASEKLDVDLNSQVEKLLIDEFFVSGEQESDSISLIDYKNPLEDYNINANVDAKNIVYQDYTLKNSSFNGAYNNDNLIIKRFSSKIEDSDINISGNLNKPLDFYFAEDTLTGTLNMSSNRLDLNSLMDNSTATGDNESEPEFNIEIPGNINIVLDSEVKSLSYRDYNLENSRGNIQIRDKAIFTEDLKSNFTGGEVHFAGSFQTFKNDQPYFNMKYDMSKMDFTEFFNEINTFKLIAPVAKVIEGIFNSSLVLEGNLQDDLYPDLNS